MFSFKNYRMREIFPQEIVTRKFSSHYRITDRITCNNHVYIWHHHWRPLPNSLRQETPNITWTSHKKIAFLQESTKFDMHLWNDLWHPCKLLRRGDIKSHAPEQYGAMAASFPKMATKKWWFLKIYLQR